MIFLITRKPVGHILIETENSLLSSQGSKFNASMIFISGILTKKLSENWRSVPLT